MLNYQNLHNLNTHCQYLSQKIQDKNIFLVGGAVRDILLGLTTDPKDIDLTMAGLPANIYNKIDKSDISHFMTEKFGTITLIPKNQKNSETLQYELTPLREESDYQDNRHPEEISWSDSIISDAQRRDFTINCIYYFSLNFQKNSKKSNIDGIDTKFLTQNGYFFIPGSDIWILQDQDLINKIFPQAKFDKKYRSEFVEKHNKSQDSELSFSADPKSIQIVIDPYKGIQDLETRKLACVGEPDKRFREDALRIVRALRIPNILNQKLLEQNPDTEVLFIDYDTNTRTSLKKNFFLLQFIAKERIKDEIIKVFKKGNPFGFVSLLDEVNLLKLIFPSLYATKFVDQPVRYHPFDVYTHTMLSLFELQKINQNYLARLGMLYHDVGKVDQYYMYKLQLDSEEIRELFGSWLNHQKSGIDLVKKDFDALKFSRKEIEEIARYVEAHHKPGEILDAKPTNRTKKLRKLFSEVGYDRVKNIIDICIGDRRGQYNPMQNSSDITSVFELYKILDQLEAEEGQFTPKDLVINGQDIMTEFQIPAGPQVGVYLQKAFDRVINDINQRNNKKTIIQHLNSLN